MDDDQHKRERGHERGESAGSGPAESAGVTANRPPAEARERTDAVVRAVPVIDQPPGDAQPPDVAGHVD
jgi:hypothetical protein